MPSPRFNRRPKRIVHLVRLASLGVIGRMVNGRFTAMLKASALPATDKLSADKLSGNKLLGDKLLGLEGLRFITTISVLLWHYQHFAYIADHPVDLVRRELPFYGLLFPFFDAGEYGVWIFWCISGFIFFWKYRDEISERSVSGWTFFVLRLSRLYPLHFVTLVLVALLQSAYFARNGAFFVYQHNDVQHFLAQLFLASDWGYARSDSFNGPIWSISVEVLVYAAFFLTLRYATKSALFNVVVILVCVNVSWQVCSCLAFFYAGGLAAIARQATRRSSSKLTIAIVAWCVAAGVPIALLSLGAAIIPWLFLLSYTPLLLFCLSGRMTLPLRLQRGLEAAGNMTYSCYLLHFPIQVAIALVFSLARSPAPLYQSWFFLAFVLATLLAAHLTYRYFEAPAQSLIRKSLLGMEKPIYRSAAGRDSWARDTRPAFPSQAD
jgi:peptidoglycan/LPS O-acetylase OafA/YrhL